MAESTRQDGRSSTADWDPHKETIHQLYIDQGVSLKELIRIMTTQYDFKMTKSQYERRLREWRFTKNQKKRDWAGIVNAVNKRQKIGKSSDVFIGGKRIPPKKLCKELRRYSGAAFSPAPVHRDVMVLTPSQSPKTFPATSCSSLNDRWIPTEFYELWSTSFKPRVMSAFLNLGFDIQNSSCQITSLDASVRSLTRGSPTYEDLSIHLSLDAVLPGGVRKFLSTTSTAVTHGGTSYASLSSLLMFCLANGLSETDSAVEKWFYETIKASKNSDVLQKVLERDNATTDSLVERLFRQAVLRNDCQMLQTLCDARVDPNEQRWPDKHHEPRSALFHACENGDNEIAKVLMDNGAVFSQHEATQWTDANDLDLNFIRLLHDQGYLHTSVATGTTDDLIGLLLIRAADYHRVDVVGYLLSIGASVNFTNECGETALWHACMLDIEFHNPQRLMAQNSVVELLLTAGANPRLFSACRNRTHMCHGPDLCPLELAFEYQNLDLIGLLLRHGCHMSASIWPRLFKWHQTPTLVSEAIALLYTHHEEPIQGLLPPWNASPISYEVCKSAYPNISDQSSNTSRTRPESHVVHTLYGILPRLEDQVRENCLEVALRRAVWDNDMLRIRTYISHGARASCESLSEILISTDRFESPDERRELFKLFLPGLKNDLDAALVIACDSLCFDFIETLLNSANLKTNSALIRLLSAAKSEMPDWEEIESWCYPVVQRLLKAGADSNELDEDGLSPIIEAAYLHSTRILELLLRNGADINHFSDGYFTALSAAVISGDERIFRFLLSKGAKQDDAFALKVVIWNDEESFLDILLESGCNPNLKTFHTDKDTDGGDDDRLVSPLSLAIFHQHSDMVDTLLARGADPNADADGIAVFTPLQAAAYIGDMELTRRLWRRGADVNAAPHHNKGATALQYAALRGHCAIACFLVDVGAEVDAPGAEEEGRTAIEGAAEYGHIEMIELLVKAGARLIGPGASQYVNATMLASRNGFNAAKRLLERLQQKQQQESESKARNLSRNDAPDGLSQASQDKTVPNYQQDVLSGLEGLFPLPDTNESGSGVHRTLTEAPEAGLVEEMPDEYDPLAMAGLGDGTIFTEAPEAGFEAEMPDDFNFLPMAGLGEGALSNRGGDSSLIQSYGTLAEAPETGFVEEMPDEFNFLPMAGLGEATPNNNGGGDSSLIQSYGNLPEAPEIGFVEEMTDNYGPLALAGLGEGILFNGDGVLSSFGW